MTRKEIEETKPGRDVIGPPLLHLVQFEWLKEIAWQLAGIRENLGSPVPPSGSPERGGIDVEAVRQALKPFADWAQRFDPPYTTYRDSYPINGCGATVGDLRKARDLLFRLNAERGGDSEAVRLAAANAARDAKEIPQIVGSHHHPHDNYGFFHFKLNNGGSVSIPADQVERMWNAEQIAKAKAAQS